MRERLSINIKQLPALAAGWHGGGGGGDRSPEELPAPSPFAATAAKQLQILSGALAPLLLPAELHSIFGRIGLMFSRTLAEAYELLEPHGAAWEQQLRADMQVGGRAGLGGGGSRTHGGCWPAVPCRHHLLTLSPLPPAPAVPAMQFLLNCLRNLPMDPAERDSNLERLTQAFEQRFMLASAAATHMPEPRRRTASAPAATAAAGAAAVVPVTPAAVTPAAIAPEAVAPAAADILPVTAAMPAAAAAAAAAAMPAAPMPVVTAAQLEVDPAPAIAPSAQAAGVQPVPLRHDNEEQPRDRQQAQVAQLQEDGLQQQGQGQQHTVVDFPELPEQEIPQQLEQLEQLEQQQRQHQLEHNWQPPPPPPQQQQQQQPGEEGHLEQGQLAPGSDAQQLTRPP